MSADICYSFHAEWFDAQAELLRPYLLKFFSADATVEMYDVKNRRTFLKRSEYPGITAKDLFLGAQITVYARQLKIVDFADDFSRRELSASQTRGLIVVKPAAFDRIGDLLDRLAQEQFVIGALKMTQLNQQDACEFFGDDRPTQRADELLGGPVVAMEILGSDAWNRLGVTSQDVHMSENRAADIESSYLLRNPRLGSTARCTPGTTVCVIKPHALLAGIAGQIVKRIMSAGFKISAMQLFSLDPGAAKEFLEVYKGVSPDYNASLDHFISGPCLALELVGAEDIVDQFRDFCGPNDPDIARHIRPKTLRAEFGQDRIRNAVHCTDLVEDGPLESEFFFSILDKSYMSR